MVLEVNDVRVVNFALTGVAVVATLFRLWDRERTARLWWDDAWAGFCMVLLVIFMASVEVHVQDPARHSQPVKLVVAYMCPLFFYAVTWSSRMSVLLTIIRLSLGNLRQFLLIVGVAFFVTFSILFAQIFWVCEGNHQWKLRNAPQCPLGIDVAVAQVITDVISDAILILAPLRLVWRTTLSRPQKIRITAIFSTTLITTAVSMNHVYFVLKKGGMLEALAAVIQCTITLVVANLSVIIAFFFRITTEQTGASGGVVGTENADGEPLAPTHLTTVQTHWTWSMRKRAIGPMGSTPGITSTFITVDGRVRQRPPDAKYADSFALGSRGGDGGSSTRKDSLDGEDASIKLQV